MVDVDFSPRTEEPGAGVCCTYPPGPKVPKVQKSLVVRRGVGGEDGDGVCDPLPDLRYLGNGPAPSVTGPGLIRTLATPPVILSLRRISQTALTVCEILRRLRMTLHVGGRMPVGVMVAAGSFGDNGGLTPCNCSSSG